MNQTRDASLAISGPSRVGTRLLALAAAGVAALAFMLVTAIALLSGASLGAGDVLSAEAEGGAASALAVAEIPPCICACISGRPQRYGLSWAILAGIGKVECDHGRDPDPSCTQEGAVNSAGAGGPDAVHRFDLGALTASTPKATARPTAGTRRTRSTPPPTTCGRPARPETTAGDLRLQPRQLVRRRGRELGGEYRRRGVRAVRPALAKGGGPKARTCASSARARHRCCSCRRAG